MGWYNSTPFYSHSTHLMPGYSFNFINWINRIQKVSVSHRMHHICVGVCACLTSRVTSCLAMALSTVSYIWVFWMPRPQKMANASRNCSSFLLKALTLPDASSILFTSWHTPTWTKNRKGVDITNLASRDDKQASNRKNGNDKHKTY